MLASHLHSLGILNLGSAEQSMSDGAVTEIAAKDAEATNIFSERSVNTPQAQIRKVLLSLANDQEPERDQGTPDDPPEPPEPGALWTVQHRP